MHVRDSVYIYVFDVIKKDEIVKEQHIINSMWDKTREEKRREEK